MSGEVIRTFLGLTQRSGLSAMSGVANSMVHEYYLLLLPGMLLRAFDSLARVGDDARGRDETGRTTGRSDQDDGGAP